MTLDVRNGHQRINKEWMLQEDGKRGGGAARERGKREVTISSKSDCCSDVIKIVYIYC